MSTNTTGHYGARAPEHNEMDLLRFIGEIIDHRTLILSITLLFTLGAVLFAFMSTPVYQGDVLIQVESKQDNDLLKSLSQFSGDLTPDTGPEILLLKSRMILGATVDQLKLAQQVKPQYFPVLGKFWAQLKAHPARNHPEVAEYPTAQRQAAKTYPDRPGERTLSS
jgi:tyrosine-protein kinase Etk/Wzc